MVYKFRIKRKRPAFLRRVKAIGRRKRAGSSISRPYKRRRIVRSGAVSVARKYSKRFGAMSNMVNSLIPAVKWMVHQYAQSFEISNESNISRYMHSLVNADSTIMFFRANSPYDADASAGTIHDYGSTMFAYMQNHYSRYEVYSSKCTFIFQQKNSSQGQELDVAFGVKLDDNAGLTGVNYSYEMARMDPTWHCKLYHVNGVTAAQGRPCVITHRWSRKKLDSGDKDGNSATIGSNPVYSEYFMPTVCSINPSGLTLGGPNWLVTARISYLTRWSDRKDIAADNSIIPGF